MSEDTRQSTVDELLALDDDESSDEAESAGVFADKELLEVDNIPGSDRIVGRDDHITFLAKNLREMRRSGAAGVDNVLEWGETGTGKTLTARHVCERLESVTADTDDPIASVYLNPDPQSSCTSAWREIATQVNTKADTDINVPFSGLSAEHYRKKKLWPTVEEHFSGGLVVVIDEIDKFPEINEILYTLSRTKSKDGVEVPVTTIGISNDLDFRGDIESRVQSTLQPEHRTFTPYTTDQLVAILGNRRDAFRAGALADETIETTAELAAEEHGDARRAVQLLRKAGDLAEEQGDEQVTPQHVRDADELVEVEIAMNLVKGTPLAGKLLLFAICRLSRNNPDKEWFRTSEIHDVYQTLSRDTETEPKSYNRALDALNKHVTTGLLESRKQAGGDNGMFRTFSLQGDVGHTREGLINSTPELATLYGQ
ncbi:orc1/cdc6 family replication initiation protein [Halosegnis longus]|uniref:orc1/cdc6 family replication initiation protein n=1 Tax=Halosegnis longus TaxID=2216012 RepID=UPI00129EA57F|nr:orc1/cdc6 family replication initiation protein [Halosegnis longus]